MKKLLTLAFSFLLSGTSIIKAGCGGPLCSIMRGAYQLGVLTGYTSGPPYYTLSSSDTLSVTIAPTDIIVLALDAETQCDLMDSVQWFKDGILISTHNYTSFDYADTVTGPGVYTCKFKYGYGAGAPHFIYTFYPSYTTGIVSIAAESSDLKVYPNPSNGLYTVDAIGNFHSYNTSVYDISGRVVQELKGNDKSFTIDLSGFSPGFYSLVYATDDGKRRVKKLIYN